MMLIKIANFENYIPEIFYLINVLDLQQNCQNPYDLKGQVTIIAV
jgi:hypothetical protein